MKADQPQMLVEEFEEIALKAPETVWLEFINGKLEVKPAQDGTHGTILMWLLKQCLTQRPDLRLYPHRGLQVGDSRNGRARPDGSLVPHRHFLGHGEWSPPDGVLMTVEITPHGSCIDRRDPREQCDSYAAAAIPVYLLVDRDDRSTTVHTAPEGGRYRSRTTLPFGSVIDIPEPAGITLETERLKYYTDYAARLTPATTRQR
ncbi:Uma2 family endonuclease [Streptomyces syringium]|uniref:Uma2 family endonuclease n=1 Tax=Streptomyces syringium TaxID=76729 RepID=UPI0036CE4872